VGLVSTPVRSGDVVAGGVAASVGAGLFLGLAPAASLAGRWLPAAVLLAALVGGVAVVSTSERPPETLPAPLRRFGFALAMLARLAAAVAIAATAEVYVSPLAALVLVAVVTVLAAVGVPPVAVRVAAVAVLAVLAVVVAACFTIAPVAPAVTASDDGSALGVAAAAALLTLCFFGADAAAAPGRRRGVVVAVVLVAVVCLAAALAAVHQLGAARLGVSPAPLRAALGAADASAIERLLVAGVVVACGFALLAVLRGLRVAGVPQVRLAVVGGAAAAFGVLLIQPVPALVSAAVLLLGDAVFRAIAVRHRPAGR
jgi:APA family basic amino acid/polyamine antiporter